MFLKTNKFVSPFGEATNNVEKPGEGALLLKGGALKIHSSSSDTNPNLYVGGLAKSCGRIQGWATVAPSSPEATNARVFNGNGVIQGDGEGKERTLDLRKVVNVINNLPNKATGTNGRRAVNKGCVLYPRGGGWFNAAFSTVTCCVGDPRYNTAPNLVNSVRATSTGITSGANFFRGGLYAPDREDIPEGLPENKTTVGIWQSGLYQDLDTWSASQTQSFTSVKVTFRYDQTRVKSHAA